MGTGRSHRRADESPFKERAADRVRLEEESPRKEALWVFSSTTGSLGTAESVVVTVSWGSTPSNKVVDALFGKRSIVVFDLDDKNCEDDETDGDDDDDSIL